MPGLDLATAVVDPTAYDNTVNAFRDGALTLPTFAQLTDPQTIPAGIREKLTTIDPDEPHPLNLFRVHWFNDGNGGICEVPEHLILPPELTGTQARIVVVLADRFPMIHAHKVLATFGCLVPRLVTGQFDPTRHRAVWPSTGNYCRGGVAVSRILGCHGVAVLPEGMSRERFEWLERWVTAPEDIVRTPGSESNVKEIYDECARLAADPQNIIFNQFSEFGNYLAHYQVTGRALETVFRALPAGDGTPHLAAFVSATGSAGTLAAGDYLKETFGTRINAVEALECPTLLQNGFGEHNIQGIGDKHLPLIHNAMNTDFVTAVSDRATDALFMLFNTNEGRDYLADRQSVPEQTIPQLHRLGLSSICNVVAAVKLAKYLRLDGDDVVITVATDGAEMYASEKEKFLQRDYPGGFDAVHAAETFGRYLAGTATDNMLELSARDRERIFNLGYFTWVEQQGLSVADFEARRSQRYWRELRELLPAWDVRIDELNRSATA